MKKRLTAHQEGKLNDLKKTYPNLKIITYMDFGRLWYPELFPYEHKSRLHRETTRNILQFLNDFHYAFEKLPNSYKKSIIADRNFSRFLNKIFAFSQYGYKGKLSEEDKNITFKMYQKFFNIGIRGLFETLPREFQPYLKNEIKPLLLLMLSIERFSKSTKSKIITPDLEFPSFLFDQSELSSISH